MLGEWMKEINQIKITRIATWLQSIPGNNVVNGEDGVGFVRAETMHKFGRELMEILADEIEYKSGEIKQCQCQEQAWEKMVAKS